MTTTSRHFACNTLLAFGAALLASTATAGGAVYMKGSPQGSVELSNLEDAAHAGAPLAVERSVVAAQPATARPVAKRSPVRKRSAARHTAKGSVEPTDEEADRDTETSLDLDGTTRGPGDQAAVTADSGANSGESRADGDSGLALKPAQGGYASSMGFGGYTSGSTYFSAGADAAGTTQSGSSISTQTNSTAGAAGVGSFSGSSNANINPALATALQQYRQLMIQDASTMGVSAGSNPAITRRYLMVDRATYMSTQGK